MAESNINIYYWDTVKSIAERAKSYKEDDAEMETGDAVNYAIDDELIYYVDQAYVKAYYIITYCPAFSENIDANDVYMMLYDDVMEELEA